AEGAGHGVHAGPLAEMTEHFGKVVHPLVLLSSASLQRKWTRPDCPGSGRQGSSCRRSTIDVAAEGTSRESTPLWLSTSGPTAVLDALLRLGKAEAERTASKSSWSQGATVEALSDRQHGTRTSRGMETWRLWLGSSGGDSRSRRISEKSGVQAGLFGVPLPPRP